MKLLDSGWKCTAQNGNLRRLIEARRNDNVARYHPFAAVNLDDIIAAVAVALDRNDARAVANRQVSRKRFEMNHDFVLRHEAVRIVFMVANSGQPRLPPLCTQDRSRQGADRARLRSLHERAHSL